jgi:hypothetical protein
VGQRASPTPSLVVEGKILQGGPSEDVSRQSNNEDTDDMFAAMAAEYDPRPAIALMDARFAAKWNQSNSATTANFDPLPERAPYDDWLISEDLLISEDEDEDENEDEDEDEQQVQPAVDWSDEATAAEYDPVANVALLNEVQRVQFAANQSKEEDDDVFAAAAAKFDPWTELELQQAQSTADQPDEDADLPFAERVKRVILLQDKNGRGQVVAIRASVNAQLAYIMGIAVRDFNNLFRERNTKLRDGNAKLGRGVRYVLNVYHHHHLQPVMAALRDNTPHPWSENFEEVVNYIDTYMYSLQPHVLNIYRGTHYEFLGNDISAPNQPQRSDSLHWNAWVVQKLMAILWEDSEGLLRVEGMSKEAVYQAVWALRINWLYHN